MFWKGVGVLVALIIAFMATERYVWHYPRYEFVFWLTIGTVFTSLLTLSPDSPLHSIVTLNLSPVSTMVLLGVFVPLFVSFILESSRAAALSPFQASIPEKTTVVNHRARAKQHTVDSLLDRMVYNSQARWFAAWLRGSLEERQRRIHQIIVESNTEELNHLFKSINLPKLFTYGNFTNSFFQNPEDTIGYIMEERANELSALPRAALLHSLMKMGALMFHQQQMEWAATLICGAIGDDLTVIKNFLDSGGDYNNLYKLIFSDVTDRAIRKRMLDHIKKEGEKVRRMNRSRGHHGIKILSDVDDTLWCSGGRWPAGCDSRYMNHVVYPGVLALFEELDMGQKFSLGPAERFRSGSSSSSLSMSSKRRSGRRAVADVDAAFRDEGKGVPMVRESNNPTFEEEVDGDGLAFDLDREDSGQLVGIGGEEDTAVVTVELPHEMGGGYARLRVEVTDSIRVVQEKVQAQWRLPPWKQKLQVTSVRGSGAGTSTGMERSQGGNLVFLSARPHTYKDLAENSSYKRFSKLYREGRLYTTPTLLAGSLSSGVRAVLHGSTESLYHRVHEVFEFWSAVWYATASFVNGRLDDGGIPGPRLNARKSFIVDEDGEEVPVGSMSAMDMAFAAAAASRLSSSSNPASPSALRKSKDRGGKKTKKIDAAGDNDDDNAADMTNPLSPFDRFLEHFQRHSSRRPKRETTTRNWEAVGKTKAKTFRQYAKLYPEYDFVFFGDNGQGDAMTAEIVSEYPEMKHRLKACFVHQVQENRRVLSTFDSTAKRDRAWARLGIWKYNTYVGAAVQALKLGLIAPRALHRVGVVAHEELTELMLQRPYYSSWKTVVDELNADIKVANSLLKKVTRDRTYLMSIPEVEMPHEVHEFAR